MKKRIESALGFASKAVVIRPTGLKSTTSQNWISGSGDLRHYIEGLITKPLISARIFLLMIFDDSIDWDVYLCCAIPAVKLSIRFGF